MPTAVIQDDHALISVIVPLYNQQRYIKKCVGSIIKQTYQNLEIIIVNDGSSDKSLQIVQKLASFDCRISIVSQKNKGEAEARKTGYLNASGEWIVFVDSDDALPIDSIELLYSAAVSHHVDLVCGDYYRQWGPLKKYTHAFPRDFAMREIRSPELFVSYYLSFFGVNLIPVNAWGKIYKKSVIDKAMERIDVFLTPRLHMGPDETFNLHVFPYVSSLLCLDKSIYFYRFGGITSKYNKYLTELLDFGDYRIGLLDHYRYEAGYIPLFIEYVNILISHIQQGLEYGVWCRDDARQWLLQELEGRYLVQRMTDYFKDNSDIPNKCELVLVRNVDGLLALAEGKRKQNRWRIFAKKVLRQLSARCL